EGHELPAHLAAEGLLGACFRRRASGELEDGPLLFADRESRVVPRQREAQQRVDALRVLRLRPLEELAPRGDIPEQVAHFHGSPGRRARIAGVDSRATLDVDARPLERLALA